MSVCFVFDVESSLSGSALTAAIFPPPAVVVVVNRGLLSTVDNSSEQE